jgi:endonuclease YncB( thermonuclease family)
MNKFINRSQEENKIQLQNETDTNNKSPYKSFNDYKDENTNTVSLERKYVYYPLVKNIKGYVVSQQDADNFLIDLSLSDKLKTRYESVGKKKYIYFNNKGEEVESDAYKCHLFGITILEKGYEKGQRAYNLISRKINDSDGLVLCDIGDIDIYGRILVTLYEDTNLTNLNKMLLITYDSETKKPFALRYGNHK